MKNDSFVGKQLSGLKYFFVSYTLKFINSDANNQKSCEE